MISGKTTFEYDLRGNLIAKQTENLIKVSYIKSLAENLGIKKVTQKGAKTPDEIIETLTLVQNNENMR